MFGVWLHPTLQANCHHSQEERRLIMESIPCPLCGVDDAEYLWSKQDARYVRCKFCSLVYENPRPTAQELVKLYSSKTYFIQESETSSASGYKNYFTQCTRGLCEEYFDIVERYARKASGMFCDVGCGPGGVLKIARERGWKAVGVEISSWAANEGRKDNLDIIEGSLIDAKFPDEYFDAVSMFDVLEHLATPKEYMKEIRRVLKSDGVLVIETPNVDGFFARYVYKQNADLIKPRAHICLYGRRSANWLFSSLGFSTVKIMTFPYSRRISRGYLKSIVASRIIKGRTPVQLTLNDSLRIIAWK